MSRVDLGPRWHAALHQPLACNALTSSDTPAGAIEGPLKDLSVVGAGQ